MKRHEYRIKIISAVYKHLLLKKDLVSCFTDAFEEDSNEFVITVRNDLAANKDAYVEEISALLNKWDFDRLNYVEQAILLTACAEVKTKINDRGIVIDEAVRIAKEYCDEDSFKYINGVLDQL